MTSHEDTPLAGTMTLTLAALCTLALFWMLRSHAIPSEAWALAFVMWACGTAITMREKGAFK